MLLILFFEIFFFVNDDCMCKSETGAGEVPKEELKQTQFVKDVHIGVFFEGSGLNMVREYINSNELFSDDSGHINSLLKERRKLLMERALIENEITDLNMNSGVTVDSSYSEFYIDPSKQRLKDCQKREKEIDLRISQIEKSLRSSNVSPSISPRSLCDIMKEGNMKVDFTNISLLYSLFTGDCFKGTDSYVKKIYIEGSGTTDISEPDDMTEFEGFRVTGIDSVVGFGLGTGSKGVTALVSKAVRYVADYVGLLERRSRISSNKTVLHFYVFGFSRGSACARIFCHLLTRELGSVIKYEEDFGKYAAGTLMNKDGRLEFLDEFKRAGNITVDFLGLFDTVASIGFLQRRDGSSPLQDICGGICDIAGEAAGVAIGTAVCPGAGTAAGIAAGKYIGGVIGGTAGEFIGRALTGKVTVGDVLNSAMNHTVSGLVSELANHVIKGKVVEVLGDTIPEVVDKAGEIIANEVGNNFGDTAGNLYENYYVIGGETEIIPASNGIAKEIVWHYNNVNDFGLYTSPTIKSVCHLCAMDEYRENFALVNVGESVPGNAVEIMIPGCHSDIGGSYLDNNEKNGNAESINIYKRIDRIKGTVKMCSSTCNVKPINGNSYDVGGDIFKRLGWLDDKSFKVISEFTPIFSIKRDVKRGYSDIALAMMWIYCTKKCGEGIFSCIPPRYQYQNVSFLKTIGNKFVGTIESLGGLTASGRFWFVPESEEDYKTLRLNYLHFSANDIKPLPTINSPNYDEDGVMCRITYHGDKGSQKDSKEGVHYIYNLKGVTLSELESSDTPVLKC